VRAIARTSTGAATRVTRPALRRPTVWLVLPAYNEAENLPRLLERVGAAWTRRLRYRVLVVDDGSRDATAALAAAASPRLPVEVVRHEHNRGLAAAIRTAMREVSQRAVAGDIVVTMDADNSHPPELVPEMVARIDDGYDLVIASRFARGGREEGVPWPRRLLSRAASVVFRGVCPIDGVRDYTTGFRAYRAALLKRLWSMHGERLVEASAFSVMTEILLKARAVRPRIAEVPLVLRYDLKDGPSKMRLGSTVRDYLGLLRREARVRRT
jgi:dolichol-phosphate mannosyltransferase